MSEFPEHDPKDHCLDESLKEPTDSLIVHATARGIAPFILLIGLYVFFHGHYSPGGGFQGGVLLAVGFLLLRLSLGVRLSQIVMPHRLTLRAGAIGALLFVAVGLSAVIMGGNFLDYHLLPIPGLTPEYLRYFGILLVEVGVTVTVTFTLVAIYDELLGC
jgi:multicomponent Na+:H+ antiporter subunit B